MARVYCAFKECSHLLDYYHCYSFLVDNYLKKQNKKPFFLSITIGSRTLTLTLTLTLRTFSTLFRSICPFLVTTVYPTPHYSPPYYGLPRPYSHSISLTLAPLPFHLLLSTSYSSSLPLPIKIFHSIFPFHYRSPYF